MAGLKDKVQAAPQRERFDEPKMADPDAKAPLSPLEEFKQLKHSQRLEVIYSLLLELRGK